MFQLYYDHAGRVRDDVLSGLTVAFALVPEAVAFAFVAGVNPLIGLYGAFLMGLVTSLIGGRSGMISGATGSMAVVMVALVAEHGVEYLFVTLVLTGMLQMMFGVAKFGKYIRMVPYPVMLGFVNGLAIVIFLAQMEQFKVAGADGVLHWLNGEPLFTMLGLVGLTMAIMYVLPKITRAIPAGLVAIITISLIAVASGLDTKSVGDIADISGSFPAFHIPETPFHQWFLWRYGWLRHDRTNHDQCLIRWSAQSVRHRCRTFFTGLHHVCIRSYCHGAGGSSGGTNVYGGYRNL